MKIYKFFFLFIIIFFSNLIYSQEKELKEESIKSNNLKEIEEQWLRELKKQDVPKAVDSEKQKNTVSADEPPSVFSLVIRFVITLAIFGFLFYYFIRFLKKKNLILNQENSPVQILATIPLMSGKFLQIVDIAGQLMVLGISENNVNLIQIIEKSTVSEQIRLWFENQKNKTVLEKSLWKDLVKKLFGEKFSLWHQGEKKMRNFYSELTNQKNEKIKIEDLNDLLKLQKEKLKQWSQNQL